MRTADQMASRIYERAQKIYGGSPYGLQTVQHGEYWREFYTRILANEAENLADAYYREPPVAYSSIGTMEGDYFDPAGWRLGRWYVRPLWPTMRHGTMYFCPAINEEPLPLAIPFFIEIACSHLLRAALWEVNAEAVWDLVQSGHLPRSAVTDCFSMIDVELEAAQLAVAQHLEV